MNGISGSKSDKQYPKSQSNINRNLRDRFKNHKYHKHTIQFCENYDQPSFDKEYDTLPLEFFEPIVRRIFERTPWQYSGNVSEPAKTKMELASAYPQ